MRTDPFPRRQLQSLTGVALLSPILRLIPGSAAAAGGRAAWAGPLAALPLLFLYAVLLRRLRRSMLPGETLPELSLRALGPRGGRAALLLLSAWLLFYCGFVLRSGAERLMVTIYPRGTAAFFVVSMAVPATLAALGPFRSLLRTARMAEPVLLLTLGLILWEAMQCLDPGELLPLTHRDAEALLCSAVPAADLLCFALAVLCFFRPAGEGEEALAPTLRWLLGMTALLCAVGAAVQGRFGAALSARLTAPFFALVRNLVFFRSLERVEALVVGLWIVPDFLLTGLTLHAAQLCLRLCFSCPPREGERRLDLGNGRILIWLGSAAAVGLGLLLGRDPAGLLFLSRALIPLLSLGTALLLIPGIFFLGKLKKRL